MLTVTASPSFRPSSAPSSAEKLISGSPGVALRPPLARGDDGARRRRGGIGDAAVAPERPVRAGDLARRAAVDPGDDPAQHRRGLDLAHARHGMGAVEKARELVVLDVDEEVGRRPLRQLAGDERAQVGVDLADGGEHASARARARAPPTRSPPTGPPSAASAQRSAGRPRVSRPRPAARASRRSPQAASSSAASAPITPAAVASARSRRPENSGGGADQKRRERGRREHEARPRPGAAGGGQVAEELRGADVAGARQRPEREDERGQRPVERRLRQRQWIDPERGRHRQPPGGERRQRRAAAPPPPRARRRCRRARAPRSG